MRAVESLRESVESLTHGFRESVEYVAVVRGRREARRAIRSFDGLIAQLEANAVVPLPSRQQGSGGGGKAGSRPTMNMAYANMVDTIHEQAEDAWCVIAEGPHEEETLRGLLHALYATVRDYADERPNEAQRVARAASRWVHDARVMLGYESRKVTLADTVCGACGGTLVVAVDATSDVRCVGTAASEPCGMVYGRLDWVSLLG